MLFRSSVLTALLASLTHVSAGVAAVPVERRNEDALNGWGYATFYNDNACTQNAGVAVSMGNSGCLANEYGRNSIYIQPGTYWEDTPDTVSLVWSPGNECNCQNDCFTFSAGNNGNDYCMILNGHAPAESFRFIRQGCGSNNC